MKPEMDRTDQVSRVADCMSEHVVTMRATETMDRAAQMMVERGVGSAVVMRDGAIEGIITERDVLRAVARGLVPWSTSVSDCMTVKPTTVSSLTTPGVALSMLLENGYRHLPVVDDGALVGIVSLRDLAAVAEAEVSASESPVVGAG